VRIVSTLAVSALAILWVRSFKNTNSRGLVYETFYSEIRLKALKWYSCGILKTWKEEGDTG